jgi:DNA-binding transcriptional LysR family regulator
MDTLQNLRAFLASVRHGSFSEAGRKLHVVPSVIAKRVSDLERTLNTQLLFRSTRELKLTEAGIKFHARATNLLAEFDSILQGMNRSGEGLEGHLRVKMPTTLTVLHLATIVSDFQREHDRITLEVTLVDRSINPIEEGYDVVVSGLSESYEGVTDIPLCPLKRIVCASPAYLEARAILQHPNELADYDCLVFKPQGPSWQFESPSGPISVDVSQKLITNDNYILYTSAISGNGIAILPDYLVRPALESKALVAILDKFPLRETWLKALVPKRRERLPHVVAFTEWLRSRLADVPPWESRQI